MVRIFAKESGHNYVASERFQNFSDEATKVRISVRMEEERTGWTKTVSNWRT